MAKKRVRFSTAKRKSHSHKTKKRLEIKRLMLEAKKTKGNRKPKKT